MNYVKLVSSEYKDWGIASALRAAITSVWAQEEAFTVHGALQG